RVVLQASLVGRQGTIWIDELARELADLSEDRPTHDRRRLEVGEALEHGDSGLGLLRRGQKLVELVGGLQGERGFRLGQIDHEPIEVYGTIRVAELRAGQCRRLEQEGRTLPM